MKAMTSATTAASSPAAEQPAAPTVRPRRLLDWRIRFGVHMNSRLF